jgi:hypothetical protein
MNPQLMLLRVFIGGYPRVWTPARAVFVGEPDALWPARGAQDG